MKIYWVWEVYGKNNKFMQGYYIAEDNLKNFLAEETAHYRKMGFLKEVKLRVIAEETNIMPEPDYWHTVKKVYTTNGIEKMPVWQTKHLYKDKIFIKNEEEG